MSDITTIGNIGEPQLKWTSGGKPVLEFPLAENHSKKNAQGGWDDDGTTWRRVTIWDKKAETLAEALNKGDRVIVTGTERLREYTAKDGTQGKSLEVTAREVGIIPRAPQQQQPYTPPAAPAQQDDPWAAQGHGSSAPF